MENIIAKIDKNFAIQTGSQMPVCFFDVRKAPFAIYGLYKPLTEKIFKRLPDDVAERTSEGVKYLYTNTAGGRVRFSTDSPVISIKTMIPCECGFAHMTTTGTSGFDIYEDTDNGSIFAGSFVPPTKIEGEYESCVHVKGGKMRTYTLHFPLYTNVHDLYVGINEGYSLGEGRKYREEKPIVYYGSSITQGACATKPGNCYTAIVSRRLNLDHINLGFSGNAKGEDAMCEYIASLDMLAFVQDYDHNAPTAEHLRDTAAKLYETVRKAQPDLPYIMATRPNFNYDSEDDFLRRKYIFELFTKAYESGDRNVYFIDGQSFFRGPDESMCTVEGCHPTDVGFEKMANAFECELMHALRI